MHRTSWLSIVVCGVCLLASGPVRASSGIVSGRFRFQQLEANCTNGSGGTYSCANYNTLQGVRHARVEIKRDPDNTLLGTGFTAKNGYYNVNWTDTSTGGDVPITITCSLYNVDGRFFVGDSFTWYYKVINKIAPNGGTLAIGSRDFGADPHANVYAGAEVTWGAFSKAQRLWDHYGYLQPCPAGYTCQNNPMLHIDDVAVGPPGKAGCPNGGYTDPWNNWICLSNDDTGHLAQLASVSHEMGHVAHYVSQAGNQGYDQVDYNYDCVPACNEHEYTSKEYPSAQWIEAIADQFSHMTWYTPQATLPYTCVALFACDDTANSGGLALEPTTSDCGTYAQTQISADRMLWDLYDSNADSKQVWINNSLVMITDGSQATLANLADGIAQAAPGTGNHQRDEVGTLSVVDPFGRSTFDYQVTATAAGVDTYASYQMNCPPPGVD